MNDKYVSRDNLELVIDGLKVGMTSDWNENDKSEFSYIRNKPFYTEYGTIVDNYSGEIPRPKCIFDLEKKYDVIWNGTRYNGLICYAPDYNDGLRVIGGDEYPFYIETGIGRSFYVAPENGYTVSVLGDIVHQLDEKYIPDSVARIYDLSDLSDSVSNNTLNISTLRKDVSIVTNTADTNERNLMTHKTMYTSITDEYKWGSVIYGNGKYVAVALREYMDSAMGEPTNRAVYSTDGIRWIKSNLPYKGIWSDVAYGNGKYIAILEYDMDWRATKKAAYSTDGVNWTPMNMPVSAFWARIVYGNNKFVAFGTISSRNYVIYSSTDGINWTSGTVPYYFYDIAYGNDKFVATGADNGIAYSADGINWAAATVPDGYSVTDIAYGKGKFVAILNSTKDTKYVLFSADGINWDFADAPIGSYSVQYCNGNFIIYASSTSLKAAYSSDCINWTLTKLSENMPEASISKNVVYANNKLTGLFTKYMSGVDECFVYQSVNGIDWYQFEQQIVQDNANITDKIKDVVLPIFGTSEVGQILSVQSVTDSGKPVTWATVNYPQSDWSQTDETAPDYIKNKPNGDDYVLPVGGDELGGVKNGGNVVINADGTMTAPDSGGKVDFRIDETLILKDGALSVNTTDSMEQDNTLPITSAGVFATVGNIEALLKTI